LVCARHRVVRARDLYEVGISPSGVSRWVARGRLRREHRGVCVYGNGELTTEGTLYAAAIAVGDDAAVSHISAAVLHGFWPYAVPSVVDVIVPRDVRSRPGIRVHKGVANLTTHLGIPVTTAARTVCDLAATIYSDRAFRRVVHEAQVKEKVDVVQLRAEIRPGCPGAPRIAAEIADGAKPTRSCFEDWAVELLRRHDFPRFETNVHLPGTPDWVEVDIFFGAQKLVIEVDGDRFHSTPYRRAFDARKQAIVEAAGFRVLRLSEDDAGPARELQTVARIQSAL
jgi:very-short-patch-repair endonuclease